MFFIQAFVLSFLDLKSDMIIFTESFPLCNESPYLSKLLKLVLFQKLVRCSLMTICFKIAYNIKINRDALLFHSKYRKM